MSATNETGRFNLIQEEKTPKVSVCVITYNQEKYIRQCLQSILDQETDFDFEVIVGEDCSTDNTRAIVQEFAEQYPGVVKTIFQEKNIGGGVHNYLTVHNAARGEYIAHVDGDDYCLPGKLQAQANVLDDDPNCNIVWHRMLVETISGKIREDLLLGMINIDELRFDRGAIIQHISIGKHSSKMYRKAVRDFVVPDFDVTDYFADVEQVRTGVARFVGHKTYGVYRMGIGIEYKGIRLQQALAKSFDFFYKKYPEFRLQVNTAALIYLIADLKHCRKSWTMFFSIWIRTFQVGSIINLLHSWRFIKKLSIPD